ncbi:MAG: SIR2 family protein [Candidatus Omnitrophota bacterium]
MQNNNKNIVYLTGAGFSHAITPNNSAPLTKKLGEELGQIFPKDLKQKLNFSPENIELFLTKIDMRLLEKPEDYELISYRKKVTDQILGIFSLSKLCEPWDGNGAVKISDTADNLTKLLFKENDRIITLNYDCYLENVLWEKGKWRPDGGYECDAWQKYPLKDNPMNIRILKLHGSINFVLCTEECTGISSVDYEINPQGKKEQFAVSCKHKDIIGREACKNKIGYVVAPSYIKQLEYQNMLNFWRNAVHKLIKADVFVIMGVSLRPEDYLLRVLISMLNKKAKVIIIDPNACKVKDNLWGFIQNRSQPIEKIKKEIENITEEDADKIYR